MEDEPDYGIRKALPHLIDRKLQLVKKSVEELGVPDEIRLKDITKEDLMKDGLLKEKAATILTNFWQTG